MTGDTIVKAFRSLPSEERGPVFDAIRQELWASEPEPSAAFKKELDRRIADIESNPDDEFSVEDVMTEADEVIRQCRSE